jgi:predicted Zn-dependent protease
MFNVLIAVGVAAGLGTWIGYYAGPIAAVVLGILIAGVTWVLLVRRTSTKLQARMSGVEKHLSAGKIEPAIKALDQLRDMRMWQFGLDRAIDGHIGMLMYVKGDDLDGAKTRLERAPLNNPTSQAMLAAWHVKKKDWDAAFAVFERALKKTKKSAFLWATYTWCKWKKSGSADAITVLQRASLALPSDENIKKNLQALQNGKKLKMNSYGNEWWSLRLEAPPQQMAAPSQAHMHPAMVRAARQNRRHR